MADVNTAQAERRDLRFESIDDALAEIDRIAAADEAGTLRRSGNWTTGQVFGHIAAWIEYGYDGYPLKPPPFFIRWYLRSRLKRMLDRGMPAGVRIPGLPAGTLGIDELSTGESARRVRAAFRRLASGESCPYDSPAFGRMSHEDRVRLNLRHAELHLSFLHP